MPAGRIREAGDSALLMELAAPPAAGDALDSGINGRAVAAARQVEQRRLAGVRDVVSTFRSVAVFVDPLRADVRAVTSVLGEAAGAEAVEAAGRVVDVPAGADLTQTQSHVHRAHTAVDEGKSKERFAVPDVGWDGTNVRLAKNVMHVMSLPKIDAERTNPASAARN